MFHLLQGLGWGERKTANEIKQKFPSPWCLATIQCARETVRCLQMFSLSCINFTGSLLCTKENSKKKNPTTSNQICLTNRFVCEWVSAHAGVCSRFFPSPSCGNRAIPLNEWEADHPLQGRVGNVQGNQTDRCQSKLPRRHPITAIEVSAVMYQ